MLLDKSPFTEDPDLESEFVGCVWGVEWSASQRPSRCCWTTTPLPRTLTWRVSLWNVSKGVEWTATVRGLAGTAGQLPLYQGPGPGE